MITNPFSYLFVLAIIATFLSGLEQKTKWNFFKYIPAVVLIYASTMLLASFGLWELNKEINDIYKLTKTNLLPAMIFLMLLQVDIRQFLKLGKKLIIAYILAVASIALGFILISLILGFDKDMLGAFGALAGSWMGGTANMVAVGSALGVSDEAFGYALIVDSFNYTFWVAFLLFIVGFANLFNKFTDAKSSDDAINSIGCACNIGAKRYWSLIILSLAVSFFSQVIAQNISIINSTTTMVVTATFSGVLASFTRVREINGSSDIATSMLYMLIALIGSRAVFESFEGIGFYVLGGFLILVIHALIMVAGAKIFKLDLFSICVASLSNIGGVASAPILAAAYNKSLVGVGVLMAIMGYIIGTFGGLFVGNILEGFAK
ncbi:DUF819 domain-containing protein [Sulfurimonas lithotrophica]|uniref:DUF819 domain-containing protein n=1 Tax=Sulfurimonas lithotrophica TaxID=2590022 RepID=A0A5P8P2R6_9BACT|nr:DUF819 family protein [Sulfurimonas lithotrophica]QFR50043.1 DUF819 domain-containing protein [Sulfurimonas lithotrophica]